MKIFDFKRLILSKTGSKAFFLKFNLFNEITVGQLIYKTNQYNQSMVGKTILSRDNEELDKKDSQIEETKID